MSANPAVKLILQPLRKLIDVADSVDVWREKNKGKIDEAMSKPKNHRKSATEKEICVDGSLSVYDRFALTTDIEMVVANLEEAGSSEIANQFRSLIAGVDETGGDDQIPMDALRELLDLYCPTPSTDAEAIYLGKGKIKVGDTEVKWTNKIEIRMLEYLVEHREAETHELKREVRVSNPSECMARMQKRDGGRLAKSISRPGQKGEGGYSTTIIDGR